MGQDFNYETEVVQEEAGALSAFVKAEIDIQIATAKKYPRSLTKFRQDAMSMATIDADIASSCFYKLKRGGKAIEGPSVRLAEIIASAWGNIRFGARIVEETEKFVVAQGMSHDLEKNLCTMIEVSRRITGKDGKRYSDDMVQVTKNAACSIALRNAIYKTIPFAYAKEIYVQAKLVAIGNSKTLVERRGALIDAFGKMGVAEEQICDYVCKTSMEEIGLAEIEDLIGVFNSIKDGDSTIDAQFNQEESKPKMPKAKTPEPAAKEEKPAKKTPQKKEKPQKKEVEQEKKDELSGNVIEMIQCSVVADLCKDNGVSVQDMYDYVNDKYCVSLTKLPVECFDELCDWVRGH